MRNMIKEGGGGECDDRNRLAMRKKRSGVGH